MSSASGIRAGQAFVELLADDSQLRAGLASAQKQLSTWGSQIRRVGLEIFAAGAGMLTPLLAATKQFASSGDALAKMSMRTGMSVEVLSELKHAASLSGASLEDLEKASRRLSVTITGAMKGNQAALDALGGTKLAKQLAALNPNQQFLAVARAIGQIADPTRRAAAAVAVFGRSGTMLLPLIAEMDTLRDEAHKLGATMSTEQAQKAAALQDAWERIEGALARITKALGSALAPALTQVAGDVLPVLVAVKQWIAHNQAVVLSIAKIGAVIAAVGSVVIGFATVVTAAAWAVRAIGTAVSVVTSTFALLSSTIGQVAGLVVGAIGVMGTAAQALPGLIIGGFAVLRGAVAALPTLFSAAFTGLPALVGLAVNPVVLLGAAVVGLGLYLDQTTAGGTQALAQLGQAFAAVADDAVTAFTAISAALSAGDIRGAVTILWAFIQLEWTRGIAAVENVMSAFAGGVAKLFLNVGFGINTAFWTVVDGIQTAIDWVVGGIAKVFSTVLGTIGSKIAYLLELVDVLDEGTSQQIADISTSLNAGIGQVQASRKADRDERRSDLQHLWDEKIADVNDGMAGGMERRDAEIAAKRADLDRAIAEAKQARTSPAKPDAAGSDPDSRAPALDTTALSAELAQRMNTVQLKVDTLGTFNAGAISEMGVGGTAAERGFQAQEKTARNTERIMNAVESNDLAFE